jgi:hypothetical protein
MPAMRGLSLRATIYFLNRIHFTQGMVIAFAQPEKQKDTAQPADHSNAVMNFLPLSIQIISGAAAGAIAGSAIPTCDLRAKRNSILGLIGGILGGEFLRHLFAGDYSSATDMRIFLCSVAGGALGGSLLVIIVGFLKNIIKRKP